jgi:hypothetical protein
LIICKRPVIGSRASSVSARERKCMDITRRYLLLEKWGSYGTIIIVPPKQGKRCATLRY